MTWNIKHAFVLGFAITALIILLPQTEAQEDPGAAIGGSPEIMDLPMAPAPEPEESKFQYNAQGFRDPFEPLIGKKTIIVENLEGLAGMQISELALMGIQIGLGHTAMVKGSDDKTYAMKVGDVVADGKLVEIQQNKVVFEKQILDAFGRVKETKPIGIYLHR